MKYRSKLNRMLAIPSNQNLQHCFHIKDVVPAGIAPFVVDYNDLTQTQDPVTIYLKSSSMQAPRYSTRECESTTQHNIRMEN